MKWYVWLLVLLIIGSTSLILIQSESTDTVKVGVVSPFTGANAAYGRYNRQGIELAANELNDQGGINGKQIELVYEDSESDSSVAVTALQHMINLHGMESVIVSAASPETMSQAPVAEERGVVLIAPGSAAPPLRWAGDYIFRVKVSADVEVRHLMEFTRNELGADSIYILYVQNAYGTGMEQFARSSFIEFGGQVLGSEGFPVEETNFQTILQNVNSAKPDVVVLAGWERNLGNILKQANEMGIEATYVAPAGTIGPEIIEIAGEAANGLMYSSEYDPFGDSIAVQKFIDLYNKKHGEDPELFSAMGYDAMHVLAIALEQCGNNADCIRDELYQIRDHDGASGVITFDEYGDVVKPMIMMEIVDGIHTSYAEHLAVQSGIN